MREKSREEIFSIEKEEPKQKIAKVIPLKREQLKEGGLVNRELVQINKQIDTLQEELLILQEALKSGIKDKEKEAEIKERGEMLVLRVNLDITVSAVFL